jgi:hypothetical protein
MFISKEEIAERTGITVSQQTLQLAQLMIEAWVGKDEAEVNDAGDFAILGNATLFQAVYLGDENATDMLQQAAVKSMVVGETNTSFDTDMFSPYMSPWAIKTCRRLSFVGSRSVRTGPVFEYPRTLTSWVTD